MSFRALAWIHSKSDQFSIKNQSNNEPETPRISLNAYTVSKPYIRTGLDDSETLRTSKTMIYVTFGSFSSITIQITLLFLGFFSFFGVHKSNNLIISWVFWLFGVLRGGRHPTSYPLRLMPPPLQNQKKQKKQRSNKVILFMDPKKQKNKRIIRLFE